MYLWPDIGLFSQLDYRIQRTKFSMAFVAHYPYILLEEESQITPQPPSLVNKVQSNQVKTESGRRNYALEETHRDRGW